jgi:hypothetical protein
MTKRSVVNIAGIFLIASLAATTAFAQKTCSAAHARCSRDCDSKPDVRNNSHCHNTVCAGQLSNCMRTGAFKIRWWSLSGLAKK